MRLLAFNGTIVGVLGILCTVFLVFLGFGYFDRMPSLLPFMIFFPGLMVLCHYGYFLLARVSFLLLAWTGICTGVFLFGREGMVGIYCLPAAFLPFVLFIGREWRWLTFFSLGSLCLFLMIQFVFDIPPVQALPGNLNSVFAIIHSAGAFIVTALPFVLLFYQSEAFYREVLKKTEERALAERLADLGRMAAATAHEVNNPLTILDLVLQLVERDSVLQQRPDFVYRIGKGFEAIERIKVIVQRLLSLTQNSMDAYENIQLEDFPIILRELYSEKLQRQQIGFLIESVNLEKHQLYGQKRRILEILINLISNAIDALQDKSPKQLQVVFRIVDGDFQVRVQDSGDGIPAERINLIFAPFYTTKEIGKGSGLGLSSSRSIAKHHGGDLCYQPGPDGHFLLRLPLQPAKQAPCLDGSPPLKP